jgi:hypothetical protein
MNGCGPVPDYKPISTRTGLWISLTSRNWPNTGSGPPAGITEKPSQNCNADPQAQSKDTLTSAYTAAGRFDDAITISQKDIDAAKADPGR